MKQFSIRVVPHVVQSMVCASVVSRTAGREEGLDRVSQLLATCSGEGQPRRGGVQGEEERAPGHPVPRRGRWSAAAEAEDRLVGTGWVGWFSRSAAHHQPKLHLLDGLGWPAVSAPLPAQLFPASRAGSTHLPSKKSIHITKATLQKEKLRKITNTPL